MSLYSFNFNLLSPPPRSKLSWGSESSRAILPDFKDANELKEFMTNLFIFPFPIKHLMLQMKIGAGLLCFMLLIYLLIIARRMYERNFWILRIIKTSTGSIIAPNTILSFIVIEGAFVIVLIAMILELRYYYVIGSNKPKNILLWILLPWSILIFGAFFAALGTHYATPIDSKSTKKVQPLLTRIGRHAITINLLAIIIPTLTCTSVAIPAFIANSGQIKAFKREKEWQIKYKNQQEFIFEMVIEAQEIWYEVLKSIKIASITFWIWSFWGLFCFVLYTVLAIRLIRAVKHELNKTKLEQLKFIVTTICPTTEQRLDEEDEARIHQDLSLKDVFVNELPIWSTEGASDSHKGQNSCKIIIERNPQSLDDCIHELIVSQQTCQSIHSARSIPQESKECNNKKQSQFLKINKFQIKLPNFIMTQKMIEKRGKESIKFSTIKEQKVELKKAMINIIVQTFIISPGCACLSAIVLMFGLTFFGSFEQPTPNKIAIYAQRFAGIALLAVLYTIIFFGSICAICVFFRVYEPIFVKNAENQSSNRPTSTMMTESNQERK